MKNSPSPALEALDFNGGATKTHALDNLNDNPAVDEIPYDLGLGACNGSDIGLDQRGEPRPLTDGGLCDIGAYELGDPLQSGPTFTVNIYDDSDDGACTAAHCSLREAIRAANLYGADSQLSDAAIEFDTEVASTIYVTSALPSIAVPITIDGSGVTLDGAGAPEGTDGLTLSGDGSKVTGLTITGFGGDGVRVLDGASVNLSGSSIFGNNITDNDGLGIDLGEPGVTPNDWPEVDGIQNYPVLYAAVPSGTNSVIVQGGIGGPAGAELGD
ncbi:MAG: choice-of-anchor Q domain-containing protein, partial [Candidatus Promineifilaceae bacterium]